MPLVSRRCKERECRAMAYVVMKCPNTIGILFKRMVRRDRYQGEEKNQLKEEKNIFILLPK